MNNTEEIIQEFDKHIKLEKEELKKRRRKIKDSIQNRLHNRKEEGRKKGTKMKTDKIRKLKEMLHNMENEHNKEILELETKKNEYVLEIKELQKQHENDDKAKKNLGKSILSINKMNEHYHNVLTIKTEKINKKKKIIAELEEDLKKCCFCEEDEVTFIGGRRKKTRRKRKGRRRRTRKKKRSQRRTKKKKRSQRKKGITRKDKCAPKKNGERLEFTCYTKKALNDMKDLWNARHPDGKIISTQPRAIWEALGDNMKNTCNRESCWMKQKWVSNKLDKKIQKNTFAPTQPSVWKKKPNEWLTSIDILNVMKQYEDKHDDFEFLGPSPIDFDSHKMRGECVWDELCKFSLKNQKESGKTKIGIIFNLDPHDKPGSHWVAMFINMDKKEIYYFDSYGDRTPSKIKTLAKRVQEESKRLGKKYKFLVNRRRHQYGDSECGMYCLHFVIELTEGTSFQKFQNVRFTDKLMTRLRNIYFNKI